MIKHTTYLIWVMLLAFTSASHATSTAVVCNTDSCRVNTQVLERKGGDKFYLNADMNKVATNSDYASAKIVLHKGSDRFHASLVTDFKPNTVNTLLGIGTDLSDVYLLGLDFGLTNKSKAALFIYWTLPVANVMTSDGFMQADSDISVTRANLMYKVSKHVSFGYEVTLVNLDPLNELKLRFKF